MIVTKETQNARVDLSAIPAVIPNLVAGADAPAVDAGTFAKIDPATGREICRVARSTAADIELAVAAARRAQPGCDCRSRRAGDREVEERRAGRDGCGDRDGLLRGRRGAPFLWSDHDERR